MSNDPDQIRQQIAQTRSNLSDDVNALADTVNPAHVARRQADKVRGAAGSARDKVMGLASNAGSQAGAAGSTMTDTVSGAPRQVSSRTAGNPLAAGVIALGVGWLIGSLIPTTRKEQDAAVAVKENAAPAIGEAARVAADSLREPAQDALESVKSAATDAAQTVKDEGSSSVDDVKQQAVEAKEAVQDSRS